MALGYGGKPYILAFDHRGSFQKKMFGIEGEPTPSTSSSARTFPGRSREEGLKLAMPATQIAEHYLYFVEVYERQEVHWAVLVGT